MEDLTGKQFGKWVVLNRVVDKTKSNGAKWMCRCECGTEKVVFGKNLRKGKSTSCGCAHKRDWIGLRFGKLVIESMRTEHGKNIFQCRCDCGNSVEVIGTSIYGTISCGCSRRHSAVGKRYGTLTVNTMLYDYYGDGITYVSCTCDCGRTGHITKLAALQSGNTQSCGCVHNPDLTGKQFGRLSVIRQIESNTTKRRWLCRCLCGSEVEVQSYPLTSGHVKSCGCLRSEKNSSAEILVRETLSTTGVQFIPEHTFADCVGVNGWKLRFDFYLPDYKMAIECDGEQHFRPVEFFGGTDKFETLKQNDAIKDSYCDNNGILLLRLPYTESEEDIKTLISIFINIQESRNDHSLKGND